MKIYKIRNSDGLFSTGGHRPHFQKHGKHWTSVSNLERHLFQILAPPKRTTSNKFPPSVYLGCEIVEFELVETSVVETFEDFEIRQKEQKEIQEAERKEATKIASEKKRRREFLKLKKEFEP